MPRIEILANEINDICDSRVFSGPKQLNAAILTIYESFLAATITDAAKTLDYLNGELTGKKFRGQEV